MNVPPGSSRISSILRIAALHRREKLGEVKMYDKLLKEGFSVSHLLIRRTKDAVNNGCLDRFIEEYREAEGETDKEQNKKIGAAGSEFTFSESRPEGTANFHYFGPEVTDIPTLLEYCKINLDEWEIVETEVKKHQVAMKITIEGNIEEPAQVTNVNLRVKLKRKSHEIAIKIVTAGVLAQIERHAFNYPKLNKSKLKSSPHLLEIAIVDAHVGALILKSQTGKEYTPEQAAASVPWATEQLVQQARGYDIEEVVFLVGNDMLHFDNYQRTTTRGTLMTDAGLTYPEAFMLAERASVSSIDWLLSNVAPVRVVIVKGNHDYASSFSLGRVLEAWYRNCEDVKFIASDQPRQYVQYGKNLIGFAHGDLGSANKSAEAMPDEAKESWSETEIREVHHGHFHTTKTQEVGSITMRFLPTLCPPTKWANDKAFAGQRGANAFIYHREYGQLARFSTPIRTMPSESAVWLL